MGRARDTIAKIPGKCLGCNHCHISVSKTVSECDTCTREEAYCGYRWPLRDRIPVHGCILGVHHALPHLCDCGAKSPGTMKERESGHAH